MLINEALDAALVHANADKKTLADNAAKIAELEAATASAVDPVKAKALADAVLGADSATL